MLVSLESTVLTNVMVQVSSLRVVWFSRYNCISVQLQETKFLKYMHESRTIVSQELQALSITLIVKMTCFLLNAYKAEAKH